MPNHWLLKTEPRTYSFQQLQRDGSTVWDGVRNPLALKHLRAMIAGDRVMIYHTGSEKAVVGLARVVRAAFPDPKAGDERLVVVELAAGGPLPTPVALSTVKAEPVLKDLALVRQGRLSVMPVSAAQWAVLLGMGGVRE
jgi:predicted RNA-binding protein with PUA-like domain